MARLSDSEESERSKVLWTALLSTFVLGLLASAMALNIARATGVTNIANALWSAAIDPAVSLSYRGL
jgi:hypothetical protein